MRKTAFLLLCSSVLLTACAEPEPRLVTRVEVVKPEVPPQLTDCAEAPAVPVDPTQADVAGYILDLFAAHGDCRDRLHALVRVMTTGE